MNTNLSVDIARDEYGNDLIIDFNKIKHLLISGNSGSGKSVLLHKIINTLISKNDPNSLRISLTDQKRVEFAVYADIPHNLTEIVSDPKKTNLCIRWSVKEIERRLDIFKTAKCKSIDEYKGSEHMQHLFFIIDELSEVMRLYSKETETPLLKALRLGPVVGVHFILTTSSLSTRILTKDVRELISARIALQASSTTDSKIAIGTEQAVTLKGEGDMLYREGLKYVIRGQAKMLTHKEIRSNVKVLVETFVDKIEAVMHPTESEDETDELYEEAKELVITSGKASTSYLQRRLGIGYSRAAQLLNALEKNHIVGPANGSKPRLILISSPFI